MMAARAWKQTKDIEILQKLGGRFALHLLMFIDSDMIVLFSSYRQRKGESWIGR